MRGTVTRVFRSKGFGFILGNDGVEYFLHAAESLSDESEWDVVKKGQLIEFQSQESPRGPRAVKAKLC